MKGAGVVGVNVVLTVGLEVVKLELASSWEIFIPLLKYV